MLIKRNDKAGHAKRSCIVATGNSSSRMPNGARPVLFTQAGTAEAKVIIER